jgi:hypothetical protein
MNREIALNELDAVLAELSYPVDRSAAAAATDDVTLTLADGTANLGETIAASGDDRFESVEDLQSEVFNRLPRNAVGEPYQSEGEG